MDFLFLLIPLGLLIISHLHLSFCPNSVDFLENSIHLAEVKLPRIVHDLLKFVAFVNAMRVEGLHDVFFFDACVEK